MLSERLSIIAKEINKDETLVDIGTDHGYLPFELLKNNIIKFAHLTDISENSLNKARENTKIISSEFISYTVSDGLENINAEYDNCVIAGMGGNLIVDILGKDLDKTKKFKKIILQPQKSAHNLREFLLLNNFKIIKEHLIIENNTMFPIIVASYNSEEEKSIQVRDVVLKYPSWISTFDRKMAYNYFKYNYNKEKRIIKEMKKSKDSGNIDKRRKDLRYLKSMMNRLK